jgi:flavin-dependent dehydrogenase
VNDESFDVAVIGAGPAACAVALQANRSGLRTLVLARERPPTMQLGESLSPGGADALAKLGLLEDFRRQRYEPCYGYASAWGGTDLRRYDFILDPRGHGWQIDRCTFDAWLRQHVKRTQVAWQPIDRLVDVSRDGAAWRITFPGQTMRHAKMLIDASGRSSSLARQLGARRIAGDRQVAWLVCLSTSGQEPSDATTWVEAVEQGWWYSAVLPGGRMMAALFTDADILRNLAAQNVTGWRSLLDESHFTRSRIASRGFVPMEAPRVLPAGSTRLAGFVGPGWLAAGDAALTYDPLSGHGLAVALHSGARAALAVAGALSGKHEALANYADELAQAYEHYSSMRRAYYDAETRWPMAPFWRRRHAVQAAA